MGESLTVHLEFATFFRSYAGLEDCSLELPEKATLGEAVASYLDMNPRRKEFLREAKLLPEGKLRAIYLIAGKAVKPEELLKDGDTVKILKTFIGG